MKKEIGLRRHMMLKITMVVDNNIASSLTPEEFVKKEVLQQSGAYDLVELKIEQGDSFNIHSHKQEPVILVVSESSFDEVLAELKDVIIEKHILLSIMKDEDFKTVISTTK